MVATFFILFFSHSALDQNVLKEEQYDTCLILLKKKNLNIFLTFGKIKAEMNRVVFVF